MHYRSMASHLSTSTRSRAIRKSPPWSPYAIQYIRSWACLSVARLSNLQGCVTRLSRSSSLLCNAALTGMLTTCTCFRTSRPERPISKLTIRIAIAHAACRTTITGCTWDYLAQTSLARPSSESSSIRSNLSGALLVARTSVEALAPIRPTQKGAIDRRLLAFRKLAIFVVLEAPLTCFAIVSRH